MSRPERGRPLSPETHEAILKAVPRLLMGMSYDELTFDKIASDAGVGKAAIFRRWKSKAALVTDAIRILFESSNPALPCTGEPRRDIEIFVGNTARMLSESPAGAVLRNVISVMPHEPQLAELLMELEKERRALIVKLLEPLDTALDRDLLVSLLFGPLYFRWLVTGEPLDEAFVRSSVDVVLAHAYRTSGGTDVR